MGELDHKEDLQIMGLEKTLESSLGCNHRYIYMEVVISDIGVVLSLHRLFDVNIVDMYSQR